MAENETIKDQMEVDVYTTEYQIDDAKYFEELFKEVSAV